MPLSEEDFKREYLVLIGSKLYTVSAGNRHYAKTLAIELFKKDYPDSTVGDYSLRESACVRVAKDRRTIPYPNLIAQRNQLFQEAKLKKETQNG